MKYEKVISGIWSVVLGCMMSLSAVMCVVTAFDLQIDVGILVICCILSTLVCAVCYVLPLKLLPVSIGAVILGFLWRNGSLEESLEALLNRLTRQYDRAYGWGIIRWGHRTADVMEPTILVMLCIFGALIAMATVWSVCRGKAALPAVLTSIFCAGTCFVVTDTLPDVVWLYFLLLGMITLLLTGRVGKQDEKQGNRLRLIAMPLTALALLCMLIFVPQSTYHGQVRAEKLAKVFFADPRQLLMGKEVVTPGASSSNVDLTTVGFRNDSNSPVMEVSADFNGLIYLRGRAMNAYNGISWYDRDEEGPDWRSLEWPHRWGMMQDVQVTVSTRYAHRMMYVPYYIVSSQISEYPSGMINSEGLTEYSFRCNYLADKSLLSQLYPTADTQPPLQAQDVLVEYFIDLPDAVRAWAEPLAAEITGNAASPYHRAQAIGEYVRNSATYNTATRTMPGWKQDFALWFLEESETGYCVHFASAAAVLLQASNIPARYVTGYVAQVKAGETTIVTADKAHAWVEYWLPGFGWTVLEATPAVDSPVSEETQAVTQPNRDEQTPTDQNETIVGQNMLQQSRENYSKAILRALAIIVVLAAVAAAVWGQYRLRLYIRSCYRRKLTANTLALVCWQDAVRLAGFLGQMPDKELFEIAQKAKFSQHTITDEELARFESDMTSAKETLEKRSLVCRFYYRIILALY